MPDTYEIVLICEDRKAAAVLAVLPSLLCDSDEKKDHRVFDSPEVSCSIWEDNPKIRDEAVSKLLDEIGWVASALSRDFLAKLPAFPGLTGFQWPQWPIILFATRRPLWTLEWSLRRQHLQDSLGFNGLYGLCSLCLILQPSRLQASRHP